jgi:hypothetical protein
MGARARRDAEKGGWRYLGVDGVARGRHLDRLAAVTESAHTLRWHIQVKQRLQAAPVGREGAGARQRSGQVWPIKVERAGHRRAEGRIKHLAGVDGSEIAGTTTQLNGLAGGGAAAASCGCSGGEGQGVRGTG